MITVDFSKRQGLGFCDYLYESIKTSIRNGKLKADEKLPSKRALAEHLSVSVITVQNAYSRLISEGYIYSIEKKGFFVTDLESALPVMSRSTTGNNFSTANDFSTDNLNTGKNSSTCNEFSTGKSSNTSKAVQSKFFADFKNNSTSFEKFPFSLWARLLRQVLNSGDEKLLSRQTVNGSPELCTAIAQYLAQFRNMHVRPEQIVIGAGTEYLYSMLVQFLGQNNSFAVENPGYQKIAGVIKLTGADLKIVDIDRYGMNPELLEKSGAHIAHVSPSHHFPTGRVMPYRRRLELLNWASQKKNRYILEDDYDSEFRFNGKPLETLMSSDTNSKVIYINTFSKTLSPSFRISFMVLPENLLKDFQNKMGFYSCPVSSFEQFTLARFINEGYYEKHIIRMKNYYRNLRNDLTRTLSKSGLSKISSIQEEEAGLHFLLKIKSRKSEKTLKESFEKNGIRISLLNEYYYSKTENSDNEKIFVMNYSGLKKENIQEIILRMEKAVGI